MSAIKKLVTLWTIISVLGGEVHAVNLVAYVSQYGLHGEFHFTEISNKKVQIRTELETTLQYPDQSWNWGIYQFPVDYTNPDAKERCEPNRLGPKVIQLDETLGYLTLPGNESTTWDEEFDVTGDKGLWGKSIVMYNSDTNFRICATITTKDYLQEDIAEARFHSPIAGTVYFRWLTSKENGHSDTLIYSDLYHVQDSPLNKGTEPFSKHAWKIYATDILDSKDDKTEEDCNILQILFDPQNKGNGESVGDIDRRLGPIRIATDVRKYASPLLYLDSELMLFPYDFMGPQRRLHLVIFDPLHPGKFLSCAKLRHLQPRVVKSVINGAGIKGEVTLTQRSRFEPTWLNFTLASALKGFRENIEYAQDVASFKINELPPNPVKKLRPNYCETSGGIYNPMNIDLTKRPPPGLGTQEQYPLGDLSGKLQGRNKKEQHSYFLPGKISELSGIYWDAFLPLEGPHSIYHRGFSIQKYNRSNTEEIMEDIWTCSVFGLYDRNGVYQKPVFTAQVLYRYPIVGRILLRQPQDEPWQDTTILVEYLTHADGAALNNSANHRWAVHSEPPGKDFYNWTQRCLSAKEVFNPYSVSFDMKAPEEKCSIQHQRQCRLGDLWNRVGSLDIAGKTRDTEKVSRKIFTVQNLPLAGPHKVFGKSLVLYDDFGPKARGERLACSIIGGHFHRKAVAKNWHANGGTLSIVGEMEIHQSSEYEVTNVDVDLKGLVLNSGYHVHITPVEADLEFPCEGSSLYDHWNPRKLDPKKSPPPGTGTTDQYEMGDLSGKFGTLEGYEEYETFYNDTELPLFGYDSIIGRSIVVHKKEKNLRWACTTIERGYSPSEAREIRAIASFHHPNGYAYGYIRMTQLIAYDGSQSDTIIEVKLRHPGKNDRNMTLNHHWQIFVNGVGVDATVPQTQTRCVAGGYIWNPFYTQLADPLNNDLYREECGPESPLRCYVGDVSSRIGTLNLGEKRAVYTDPNFPLEGTQNAMGRSIVIFGPNFSGDRYACANIEPDHDIVKYTNLQKPPRFVVAQFLEEVRNVMGLPEWMLEIDSRKTKSLHNGGCVQLLLHFKGPHAHTLDKDFSRLISTGRLDQPSIAIPGYVNPKRKSSLAYRQCGTRDPNDRRSSKNFLNSAAGVETQSTLSLLVISFVFAISHF